MVAAANPRDSFLAAIAGGAAKSRLSHIDVEAEQEKRRSQRTSTAGFGFEGSVAMQRLAQRRQDIEGSDDDESDDDSDDDWSDSSDDDDDED